MEEAVVVVDGIDELNGVKEEVSKRVTVEAQIRYLHEFEMKKCPKQETFQTTWN